MNNNFNGLAPPDMRNEKTNEHSHNNQTVPLT